MLNVPCKHNCQSLLESFVSTLQIFSICVSFPDKKLFCLEMRGCDASYKKQNKKPNNQRVRIPPENNAVAVLVTGRPDRHYTFALYSQHKELQVVCQSILTMLAQKYV